MQFYKNLFTKNTLFANYYKLNFFHFQRFCHDGYNVIARNHDLKNTFLFIINI